MVWVFDLSVLGFRVLRDGLEGVLAVGANQRHPGCFLFFVFVCSFVAVVVSVFLFVCLFFVLFSS